ncbi:MAG: tyrosine-type recombinase/integrase [Lachnotalea sp.]
MSQLISFIKYNENQPMLFQDVDPYWKCDLWDRKNPVFQKYDNVPLHVHTVRYIHFEFIPLPLREELKYFFAYRIENSVTSVQTLLSYAGTLMKMGTFLFQNYPTLESFSELPIEEACKKWNDFLVESGVGHTNGKVNYNLYPAMLREPYRFFLNLYDTRDEIEKDIWDFRRIPGAKRTETSSTYKLNFTEIPAVFREMVKRYEKKQIVRFGLAHCGHEVRAFKYFFRYINRVEPKWQEINNLKRRHMEGFIHDLLTQNPGPSGRLKYLIIIRQFLAYSQVAEYPEAPTMFYEKLIFPEDMPKIPQHWDGTIKYIPAGVLQQLEDHLDEISPRKYIPVIILLRASGWRISDVMSLKYDTCLEKSESGWYLCGDISKTYILGHRVPIDDTVANVVKQIIEETRKKSNEENNPNKLLFPILTGKRKGLCYTSGSVRDVLNSNAPKFNITDDSGEIFHFKNHAFRHTKGVELINGGMNILHVPKWLAHVSPEMTMRYAKILDETMRKSWEKVMQEGVFKLQPEGTLKKLDFDNELDEDLIEWEYIRQNLDAVRMPLGYCMKPHKVACTMQLNPCLDCTNLCTSVDFIPQYEQEICELKEMIKRGKELGRSIWVEKNEALLHRYEKILGELKTGKTHHPAGKERREYR